PRVSRLAVGAKQKLWVGITSLALLPGGLAGQTLVREGSRWVETITGNLPAALHLKVNVQGPVHLEAGNAGNDISYTAKLSVQVRSEAEARKILSHYSIRTSAVGDGAALTAPGGEVSANLTVRAPRLTAAEIVTSEGNVEANGVDGSLDVNSGA